MSEPVYKFAFPARPFRTRRHLRHFSRSRFPYVDSELDVVYRIFRVRVAGTSILNSTSFTAGIFRARIFHTSIPNSTSFTEFFAFAFPVRRFRTRRRLRHFWRSHFPYVNFELDVVYRIFRVRVSTGTRFRTRRHLPTAFFVFAFPVRRFRTRRRLAIFRARRGLRILRSYSSSFYVIIVRFIVSFSW